MNKEVFKIEVENHALLLKNPRGYDEILVFRSGMLVSAKDDYELNDNLLSFFRLLTVGEIVQVIIP